MPCYSYSSNSPIYLEPNAAPFSIEAEYNTNETFSYAGIARLCEIEAKDQLCVYTKVGATETLRTLGTHYTVNTSPETITYSASLTGVDKLIIRRCTPNNKMLISFAEGAKLSAKQLNLVTHQLLFIAQEKQFKNADITHVYPLATSYGTPAAWNGGTTYGLNAYVVYNSIVYQSLQANNTNKNPATETNWWTPIEFLTKGFVIQGANEPLIINVTSIAVDQGLKWDGSKFVPGSPTVNLNIPASSITSDKLSSNPPAVATNNIGDLQVTGAKIATGTIDYTKLTTGAPTWTPSLLTLHNNLSVPGTSTLTGAVTCAANLTVNSGTVTLVGTTALTVGGALNVTGATTVQNLTVNGTFTTVSAQTYPSVVFVVSTSAVNVGTLTTTIDNAPVLTSLQASITTKRNSSAGSRVKFTASISYEVHANGAFVLERKLATQTNWTRLGDPLEVGSRYFGIAPFDYDANDSSTMAHTTFIWLDSPGDAGVYQYRIKVWGPGNTTFMLNRTITDTNDGAHERSVSSVLLEEIWT